MRSAAVSGKKWRFVCVSASGTRLEKKIRCSAAATALEFPRLKTSNAGYNCACVLVLVCHQKKTDHTRETLSASAKKRKNIPILYFLNCFIGLFLHTQKKNCLQSFRIASGLLIEHKKQEEKTCIILKLKNARFAVKKARRLSRSEAGAKLFDSLSRLIACAISAPRLGSQNCIQNTLACRIDSGLSVSVYY